MFKSIFILATIVAFSHIGAHAKTLELKKSTRSIYIEELPEWKLGKDLFGMPFIYFSPTANGQRSNISFTDTGAEVELDIKSLASSQESYQKTKKEWAESVDASVISFLPYEVKVNNHGHKVHQIGVKYAHEGKTYEEQSYYIECRGKVLFSKSLRLTKNLKHADDFQGLISSLDCGGI